MKSKRSILLVVACAAVLIYGAKSYLGVDIFKKWSFGIYKTHVVKDSFQTTVAFAEPKQVGIVENRIIVDFAETTGKINPNIFGHNFLGHKSKWKPFNKYADYGAGLWDGKWDRKPNPAVIDLAKGIGIKAARFPGGCGTHHYDWKQAVGSDREHFKFGIDEFLQVCEEIRAEPVMTVSYFTGDAQDAAELVEYTKGRVKYFEIGNEVWHGDNRTIEHVDPEEYAERYLRYFSAMKTVDPDVKIGVILGPPEWNSKVLEIVKDKIDFGVMHLYSSPIFPLKKLSEFSTRDIFLPLLAKPILREEVILSNVYDLLKTAVGQPVGLAITEYNAFFAQEKPVPYRHSLGTALLNAELIKIFMKPDYNILLANHWNFMNEYWGLVANGFDGTSRTFKNPYYKRPNYYVFEMYHKYFGEILLKSHVQSKYFDITKYSPLVKLVNRIKTGVVVGDNLLVRDWEIGTIEGIDAESRNGTLKVNFINPMKFNYYHAIKKTKVEPATYYKLSGYIRVEQLEADPGACLEVQDGRGWSKTRSAISTQKIKGTADWQYVETIYKTLSDAQSVKVIARRIGETGPLKGKAYFKNVKLEKFIPDIDTKIPYLSVNASKSKDGDKVYLMVVNKNLESEMTAAIELRDFIPAAKLDAWILNGPAVDSTNEVDHDNVKVTHRDFEIWNRKTGPKDTFTYTFEPHSLTAIELDKL